MAKHILGEWHSDNKKIEACTAYLVLGKAPLVEAVTGVPAGTIRRWKREPWWEDLVDQIQTEDDQELDGKIAKRLNKALDIIDDRLESGDFMYDPKTGEFRRKPVGLRDTWRVTKEMVDLRSNLRKNTTKTVAAEGAADILKNLASEFATMARRRLTEKVINAEELQTGVPELSGETYPNQETSPAECSPATSDEGGQGSEGGRDGCGSPEPLGEGRISDPIQFESSLPDPESVIR